MATIAGQDRLWAMSAQLLRVCLEFGKTRLATITRDELLFQVVSVQLPANMTRSGLSEANSRGCGCIPYCTHNSMTSMTMLTRAPFQKGTQRTALGMVVHNEKWRVAYLIKVVLPSPHAPAIK